MGSSDQLSISLPTPSRKTDGQISISIMTPVTGISFAAALQTIGLLVHAWFVLSINLQHCDSCGRSVYEVGQLLEGITDYNITIESRMDMYAGLWGVSLCAEGVDVCGTLWVQDARGYLQAPPFRDVLDTLAQCRGIALVAVIISDISFLLNMANKFPLRAQGDRSVLAVWTAVASGVLSITAVAMACRCYLMMYFTMPMVTMATPWGMVATAVGGYACLFSAYQYERLKLRGKTKLLSHWKYPFLDPLVA